MRQSENATASPSVSTTSSNPAPTVPPDELSPTGLPSPSHAPFPINTPNPTNTPRVQFTACLTDRDTSSPEHLDTTFLSIKKGDALEFTFKVEVNNYSTDDNFPSFTATLTSYCGFWGWNASTGEDDSWKINVNAPGEYTFHVTAPTDWEFSGAFCVETSLTELPKGYTICGDTAKLGNTTYDWHYAAAYKDGTQVRLGIWNEMGKDIIGDWEIKSNPLFQEMISSKLITCNAINVDSFGDYTIKGSFNRNADSNSNELFVYTTLWKIPSDFTISGKTVKINGREYDWSKAKNQRNNGTIRLPLWGGQNGDEALNPIPEKISVKEGDEIEVTFSVIDEPNHVPDFTATLTSEKSIWKNKIPLTTDKTPDYKINKGDSLEFTFNVEPLKTSAETEFPAFTATLTSYGGFWGWDKTTSEDDSWKINVNAPGEYTFHVIAPANWEFSGIFCVETNLTEFPEGYAICGKTAKLGEKTYAWNCAKAYIDGNYVRLGIWNEWSKEGDGLWDIKANPLGCEDEWGDWIEGTPWTTNVTKLGDYTLKGTAMQDAVSRSGALSVETNLSEIPLRYTISGKTVKIAGREYDWSKAKTYKKNNGTIALSLWDASDRNETANPLSEDIEIKAGNEIEVTFTIQKKETTIQTSQPTDTPKSTDTPAPTDTQEPTETPDTTKPPTPLAKNMTFASGSLMYKVTTAAKKKSRVKVSVIGLSPSGKKASSIKVKNTVSYSGISYKVTAISGGAFRNSAKLTKATLGTNIESIAPNAFNGCKELVSVAALGATKISQNAFKSCKVLKKLTLRERISVKKGAFKGCKKTIKVTGSSKKINTANVKKLRKCGYKKFN